MTPLEAFKMLLNLGADDETVTGWLRVCSRAGVSDADLGKMARMLVGVDDADPDGPPPSPIPASSPKAGNPAPYAPSAAVDLEARSAIRSFAASRAPRLARVTASTSPSPYGRDGFQPGTPEFEEFQRMTGTAKAAPLGPVLLPSGTLRINACCPGAWRAEQARIAARGGR